MSSHSVDVTGSAFHSSPSKHPGTVCARSNLKTQLSKAAQMVLFPHIALTFILSSYSPAAQREMWHPDSSMKDKARYTQWQLQLHLML